MENSEQVAFTRTKRGEYEICGKEIIFFFFPCLAVVRSNSADRTESFELLAENKFPIAELSEVIGV